MSAEPKPYETILVETQGRVGLIRFNRPQALNAINRQLLADLACALEGFERDPAIGALVITGNEKAFAAGADIREMANHTYPETYLADFGASPDRLAKVRKPVIAAVAGFAIANNTGSDTLGFLAAALAGAALAAVFGLLVIFLNTNQYATGLALSLFGYGFSAFVGVGMVGQSLSARQQHAIPVLSDLPFVWCAGWPGMEVGRVPPIA
jgi:enoyl-CoA hydratase/carnithine racemase